MESEKEYWRKVDNNECDCETGEEAGCPEKTPLDFLLEILEDDQELQNLTGEKTEDSTNTETRGGEMTVGQYSIGIQGVQKNDEDLTSKCEGSESF